MRSASAGQTISRRLILPLLVLGLISSLTGAEESGNRPLRPDDIESIVETFAKSSVEDGTATGVAVGVTYRGRSQFFSYGLADAATGAPVTPRTIFQIGSVTKVFTTAILGENLALGINRLSQTLTDFAAELGPLGEGAGQVTLEELGDFTAGYPSDPITCKKGIENDPPGCIPNARPTIDEYTAGDLLTYFQNFPPEGSPAPYLYSDISTGLIGLLLGATPGQPIDNSALDGWYALVGKRITELLGMKDTFLDPTKATPFQQHRAASGYQQALATATVAGGQVTAIDQTSMGSDYPDSSGQPPTVIIRGGGGTGAKAHANLVGAGEVALMLDDGGKNYVAPPEVEFTGGSSSTPATASAIISRGRVIGIRILAGGGSYQVGDRVTASITGGNRGRFSRDAVLGEVTISNGKVDFVKVLDGGRGYVDPITVIVGPTAPAHNNIPIWAAAGALNSTAVDMLQFAEAALGRLDGRNRRERLLLREGFRLAQQSYACETADPDNANQCVIGSGLAWAIARANGGVGKIITKNGGIGGFSTELHLVPSLDLGIVVLVNSRQIVADGPSKPAESIANSILYAIARGDL